MKNLTMKGYTTGDLRVFGESSEYSWLQSLSSNLPDGFSVFAIRNGDERPPLLDVYFRGQRLRFESQMEAWPNPALLAKKLCEVARIGGRTGREGDSQPMPIPSDRTAIQDLVIQDIAARKELGIQRYGTPLQAHNGRNAFQDAYEEALDLCCYLRQIIEEEKL